MKIVSWNVNSIKMRLTHVERYLAEVRPDVLMIQELKGLEFPTENFTALGYQSEVVGQKAYNGVAVISKHPITVISSRLEGEPEDEQARYLEVEVTGVRLINIYLPNGNPVLLDLKHPRANGELDLPHGSPLTRGCQKERSTVFSEKYDYKLRWMARLYKHLKSLMAKDIPFIIGGDFNVIPEAKDCKNPKDWEEDALFRIETRKAFRSLLNLGLYDALRCTTQGAEVYTFWDYQAGAWQKNNGIRIDHFLLSPFYADRLINCRVNKTPRSWDSPSDHTPIEIDV